MFRPRVIPVLLLKNAGLVKTIRFSNFNYIGDPINAVKIFNDKKADELVFLDIMATKEKRLISLNFVKKVGDEANMPFAVGGGIRAISDIKSILNAGAEKVILGTIATENPQFVKEAADTFGSSTIVVCMDIKKNWLGKEYVYYSNASKTSKKTAIEFALNLENLGVGELIVQSVENDGMMTGYDLKLLQEITERLTIPVVALGGSGNYADFKEAVNLAHVSAVAAGSQFIYHGPRKGVLINYPSKEELKNMFIE